MTVDAIIVSQPTPASPAQLLLIRRKFDPFKVSSWGAGMACQFPSWSQPHLAAPSCLALSYCVELHAYSFRTRGRCQVALLTPVRAWTWRPLVSCRRRRRWTPRPCP